MRWFAVLAMVLQAGVGTAATAYVSDELVLNVYSELNQQGQRLATLHSGASIETLSASGDFTQVRLGDGTTGWVKTAFLTMNEPAIVRVKQLEEELDRTRATTPALAEAAAKSEVERLQRQLAAKQSELDLLQAARAEPVAVRVAPQGALRSVSVGIALGAMLIAAASGFWLGYATLARRVRQKFGGLKVY